MKKTIGFIVLSAIILFGVSSASARIGVGVGVGKIEVDKPLKAGMVYDLPSLPVLNTGDEPSEYGVSIEYHEGIPQLRPEREWFSFDPSSFHLEPGEVKNVGIVLTLPLKTKPGDYFAYLEGHPAKKTESGVAKINIAAASKLYFTVAPANIFQAAYYRVNSFFFKYTPWSWIILSVIGLALIISLIKKFFKFQLGIKISKK